jgi:hypothetical protein
MASTMKEWFKRYDDRYAISNLGRVRDHKTKRTAKQWLDRSGLWTVTINGRPRRTAMLVGAVWLQMKPGERVYYRQGIDPRASNIVVDRPRGRRRWNAKLTAAKSRDIARSQLSLTELAAKYRVSLTCIYQVRAGITWGWATGIKRAATR